MKSALTTLLLLALLAAPHRVLAAAASGFGLFLTQADLRTEDAVTGEGYAKATFGGGLDYQWALGDAFSLGLSGEEAAGDASFPTLPNVNQHKVSATEIEARVWFGALFVGYHAGRFVLVTAEHLGSFDLSGSTAGDGYSLGLEGSGGWFAVAQTVTVNDLRVPNGPLVDVTGYRLRLGYRWR